MSPENEANPPETIELHVEDLGRMGYADAHALQRRRLESVVASRGEPVRSQHLLLVEHEPPVITVSRRPGARQHLVASPERLAAAGVEVAGTDRGGDITYHGPGQLVAYPILDLNALSLRLRGYMRFLEGIVIDLLAGYDLRGERDREATGVWIDRADGGGRKICAMGVRVARWVSMHGLALNVTTDLAHFDLIVPCGLAGRPVTSLERELTTPPPMDEVKRRLAAGFERAIAARLRDAPSSPG
jgi:lipoyl(octanoyl) transferase